jgi:hypothetical protein
VAEVHRPETGIVEVDGVQIAVLWRPGQRSKIVLYYLDNRADLSVIAVI